ncbi:ribonuclease Z, mitochondrial isoform X2 [Battus philenor]|uniref:ribonuclease Z, mitochondrial isoform X2 n=1 Tax=Battus philenor TaxID=42288 RepID=UPI0035D133C3
MFLADMPKANTLRIVEAQRQRQLIAKKDQNYGPSTVYLQVLGSGAKGVPNTLYLCTDQKRYLFNCGESTQRLAHEHKVKLTKLDHIFITSKTWKNIGGLPGLSLTLQDVGVPNITLHGPVGLDELYKATKRFVIMKEMNVTMAPCSPTEDFVDNVMSVKYVILRPDTILKPDLQPRAKKQKVVENNTDKVLEEFIHDDIDYYRPERSAPIKGNKPKFRISPERGSLKKKEEKALRDFEGKFHSTVAYICTLKKKLGSLDLEKCVEKGVKPGPMLGQLKNGQDVMLPDGTLVLSKDVKTPDDPGPVFIVLEVPDISYLKEEEFALHFDNGVNPPENLPTVVVHFTPPHVFHHPTYQAFLTMFGESTRHLVLNEQNTCLGSEAVHRTQNKLHLLDADIFPLLRDVSLPAVWDNSPPSDDNPARASWMDEMKNRIALALFQNIMTMEETSKSEGDADENYKSNVDFIAGRTLTMFHLRPKKELDRSAEPKLHIQDYIKETMDEEGFAQSLEQYREQVDKINSAKTYVKNDYPKVIFLGTGSCIPSKTRNTSAIVLQVDESRSMLLDCGEGTFGQLVRFFGPKRVNGFLKTLKAIYISHLHADHHIGLIGLLQARRAALKDLGPHDLDEPVHLLAPGQIVTWLSLYDQQFERIREEFNLIPNQSLLEPKVNLPETDMTPAILAGIGVQRITTCLVSHCPNAFGVAVELKGHKITYSGDTIPCKELVDLGKNSTLLIHEATMEDELADEARTKMHSTTSQAIDIGRQMNAKFTVLTHFSQRYARLPRLSADVLRDSTRVGIAFDNMQIRMKDLEVLPLMYGPLQIMFAEHCVNMELKAANRARQRERRADTSPSPPAGKVTFTDTQTTQTDARTDTKNTQTDKRTDTQATQTDFTTDTQTTQTFIKIPNRNTNQLNTKINKITLETGDQCKNDEEKKNNR